MIRDIIEEKLAIALSPTLLEVIDESHGHNVPKGAESHFKVTLVSEEFAGARAVKRHQRVYSILDEELKGRVHALALHLYTPQEWQEKGQAPQSPACMGGGKK